MSPLQVTHIQTQYCTACTHAHARTHTHTYTHMRHTYTANFMGILFVFREFQSSSLATIFSMASVNSWRSQSLFWQRLPNHTTSKMVMQMTQGMTQRIHITSSKLSLRKRFFSKRGQNQLLQMCQKDCDSLSITQFICIAMCVQCHSLC